MPIRGFGRPRVITSRRCLDFAATVQAGFVAGPLYAQVGKRRQLPENERRAEWALAVEEIRGVCEDAAQRDLCIAIEPINRFETDLCNSVADAVRMARDVDHPAARVMCDSFHMTIEEADLEAARALSRRVARPCAGLGESPRRARYRPDRAGRRLPAACARSSIDVSWCSRVSHPTTANWPA